MDTFIAMNFGAEHGDRHSKSAHMAALSNGAHGLANRCMAYGGVSRSCQGPHSSQSEENVKAAEVSDWDPAATLAALSGTANDQNAAGLLAELGSVAGESQPSMSAEATTGTYSDLRIRFVDQARRRLPPPAPNGSPPTPEPAHLPTPVLVHGRWPWTIMSRQAPTLALLRRCTAP
jgi:hypothetical protein